MSPTSVTSMQAPTNAAHWLFRRFWPRMHEYQTSLADLAHRIAQLEDALRISHERHSKEPHPLLDEDRLRIKEPFLRQAGDTHDSSKSSSASPQASSDGADANELAASLDTLSIAGLGPGRFNYIGPGAWTSVSALFG
jgi:hypothetical protein